MEVTAQIDGHLARVLVWTAIAWIGGFAQIWVAFAIARRDGLPGMSLGTLSYLLVHDASFLINARFWLETVHHWYFNFYLVGMAIAVPIELLMLRAFLRHRQQLFGTNIGLAAILFGYGLLLATGFVLFGWIRGLLTNDPLGLVPLAATSVAATLFNVPMLLASGGRRGRSSAYAWATLAGPVLAMGLFPALSALFRTPCFYVLWGCLAALAVAHLILIPRVRAEPLAT